MGALKLQTAPKLRLLSQDPIGMDGDGPNYYVALKNNPLRYTDPTGLSAQDIQVITNAFADYVQGLNAQGRRYPGTGSAAGSLTNIVSTARDVRNMAGDLVGAESMEGGYEGCEWQSQGFMSKLQELQKNGAISGDFSFVSGSTFTPDTRLQGAPGFYHQFINGVSSADNVVLTLDPWKGTIVPRPINRK